MKKLTLLLVLALCAFGCSADPMTTEEADAVGEQQQAVVTPCSIDGVTGSSANPPTTVITGISIAPNYLGTHLVVTACDIVGTSCTSDVHTFSNVHWTPAHTVNGTAWAGSKTYPLRRVRFSDPGCMLSSPDKSCLDMWGDVDSNHGLQNGERFLFDRTVPAGVFEAPPGFGVTQIRGLGTAARPTTTWQMRYGNGAGLSAKVWKFAMPGCP